MRWSAGVWVALVALASSGACGRSKREPTRSPTGGTSGKGGGGVVGGSGGSGGSADLGSGGCADTRADCACGSPNPECVRSLSEFCVLGACPPTLEDLRQPERWLSHSALDVSSLIQCQEGGWHFEVSFLEGGSSISFDSEGKLFYAAHHTSCNTPVCGQVLLSSGCRSCVLAPLDGFPKVGDGGFGGQFSTPEVYVPCQVDERGKLVVPEE